MGTKSDPVVMNLKVTPHNPRIIRASGNETLVDDILTKFFGCGKDIMGVIADKAITDRVDEAHRKAEPEALAKPLDAPGHSDFWLDDELVSVTVTSENADALRRFGYLANELLTGLWARDKESDLDEAWQKYYGQSRQKISRQSMLADLSSINRKDQIHRTICSTTSWFPTKQCCV